MSSPYQLQNDGKYQTCSTQVDDNDIIKCFRCKSGFHVICRGSSDICNKSLMALCNQKSTKRNFVWYCDACLTQLEASGTDDHLSQFQKMDDLEKKIDLLTNKVSSITDMLTPGQCTTSTPLGIIQTKTIGVRLVMHGKALAK